MTSVRFSHPEKPERAFRRAATPVPQSAINHSILLRLLRIDDFDERSILLHKIIMGSLLMKAERLALGVLPPLSFCGGEVKPRTQAGVLTQDCFRRCSLVIDDVAPTATAIFTLTQKTSDGGKMQHIDPLHQRPAAHRCGSVG
jgi:hypothetical protein